MKEIETDRLLLRRFTMDDLDELSVIFSDPEVVRYLGTGKPAKRDETEHALQTIINHWEQHGFGRWAVVFKRTQKLIGYGGLRNFHNTPELVYLLAKRYWGIGLATEIARASLSFGFDEQGFERIIAMARLANTASHRVMEKVGMNFEKTAQIYNMDIVCYAITSATYSSGQAGIRHEQSRYDDHHLESAATDFIQPYSAFFSAARGEKTSCGFAPIVENQSDFMVK
jgi:RimJ/RimL family protein N-acetyltransferase